MGMCFLVLGGSHFEMRIVGFNLGFFKSDFSIFKNDYKFCNKFQGGKKINKERTRIKISFFKL